ncbi:MAG: hypothetical protein HYY14_04960 [Candidatus Omnitrophica bacterium]|nr:hypothetical protein [Candidatus Omnitrophota bacterium]
MLNLKDRKLLIKLGAGLAAVAVSYFLLVRPLWFKKVAALDAEVKENAEILAHYAQKDEPIPSGEGLEHLLEKKEALDERRAIVMNYLDPVPLALPEGTREPSLYFREQLYTVTKTLQQMAQESKSAIPENIGFSEALPESVQVPVLLRELDVTRRVAEILLTEGVSDISLIKPLERVEHKNEKGDVVLRAIEIQVNFRSNVQSLVRVLHKIAASSPVLVARDMQSKELSSSVIETNLVVSQVITGGV